MENSCLNPNFFDSHQTSILPPLSEIKKKVIEAIATLGDFKENNTEINLEVIEDCLKIVDDVIADNKAMKKRIEELENGLKNEEKKRTELTKKCEFLQKTNMILQKNQNIFDGKDYLDKELADREKFGLERLEEKLKNAKEYNNNQLESYKLQTEILNWELIRMQEEAKMQKKICIETYSKQQNTEKKLENSINKVKILQNEIMELNFVIDCLNRDKKKHQENKREEEKTRTDENGSKERKEEDLNITDNLQRMEKEVLAKGNKLKYLSKQISKLHQELTFREKNRTKNL